MESDDRCWRLTCRAATTPTRVGSAAASGVYKVQFGNAKWSCGVRPGRAAVGMFLGGSLLEELGPLLEEELVDEGFASAVCDSFCFNFFLNESLISPPGTAHSMSIVVSGAAV